MNDAMDALDRLEKQLTEDPFRVEAGLITAIRTELTKLRAKADAFDRIVAAKEHADGGVWRSHGLGMSRENNAFIATAANETEPFTSRGKKWEH